MKIAETTTCGPPGSRPLVNTSLLARRFGITIHHARKLIVDGYFPNAMKVGKNYRIPLEDVEQFERQAKVFPDEGNGNA